MSASIDAAVQKPSDDRAMPFDIKMAAMLWARMARMASTHVINGRVNMFHSQPLPHTTLRSRKALHLAIANIQVAGKRITFVSALAFGGGYSHLSSP